ncbi:MAG: four helix bundle protein [Patescibacteria group bacterium]
MSLIKPPPKDSVPLIHSVCVLYKDIYHLGQKIPKRDKFGIYRKVEDATLDLLTTLITATFESRDRKHTILVSARINVEVLKWLVRMIYEIKTIHLSRYIALESQLQEISKMTNGWIKYLQP